MVTVQSVWSVCAIVVVVVVAATAAAAAAVAVVVIIIVSIVSPLATISRYSCCMKFSRIHVARSPQTKNKFYFFRFSSIFAVLFTQLNRIRTSANILQNKQTETKEKNREKIKHCALSSIQVILDKIIFFDCCDRSICECVCDVCVYSFSLLFLFCEMFADYNAHTLSTQIAPVLSGKKKLNLNI